MESKMDLIDLIDLKYDGVFCYDCRRWFSTKKSLQRHLGTALHKKTAKKSNIPFTLKRFLNYSTEDLENYCLCDDKYEGSMYKPFFVNERAEKVYKELGWWHTIPAVCKEYIKPIKDYREQIKELLMDYMCKDLVGLTETYMYL